MQSNKYYIINYVLTKSEVFTGKNLFTAWSVLFCFVFA